MTFRMKGPSMHEGTKGHKDALKLNFSMDKTNVADGRAGSSVAQFKPAPTKAATDPTGKDKDKVTWGKEKMTSETKTKNTKGGEDTKRTYETKGTSKGKKVERYATTPEEIAKWKAAPEKNKAKYKDKTHTKSREEIESTVGKTPKMPKKEIKEVPTPKKHEPIKSKPPKRKKWERDVEEKPGLFKKGKTKMTNTETGKAHSYKTKSKSGKFFEKVGEGIKNAVPKKRYKNKKRGKITRAKMTQCNF